MRTHSVVTFIVLLIEHLAANEIMRIFDPVDEPLPFMELAKQNGYQAEEYKVQTEDGYLLSLFRIPGRRGLPVLLMHGIADTSDTWLLRGNTSIGVALAEKEYDIWLGNVRGNKYSRRHIKLNPNHDSSFWEFTFHEHGYYDLPAIIDTVLRKTGARKLNAFGHSQGNAIFYVLGSTRPEYNAKINIMTALAPICYLSHVRPPLSLYIAAAPELNAIGEAIGINELFSDFTPTGKIFDVLCKELIIRYDICALNILFPLAGFDVKEFKPAFYDIFIAHYPAGTSRKNLNHFAQVSHRQSFSRYDYGPDGNLREYRSISPPNYDLKMVTMPIVLIEAKNDKFSELADVDRLNSELPNVKKYIIIKRKIMNHLDFVWGEHMKDYLFPYIFDVLEQKY